MLTPYEENGVFTSVASGDAWVDALAAVHPGWVQIDTWGTSVNGTPIRSVTVGTGAVSACVVTTIHGGEVAPREAGYAMMRDLAETTDPALTSYLETHAWSFIPTPNPDGLTAGVRRNANGVDLNRDFPATTQPETQAIAAWLTAHDPVLGLDLHETGTVGTDMSWAPQVSPEQHPAMRALSNDLCAHLGEAYAALGREYVLYTNDPPINTLYMQMGITWAATGMTLESQSGGGNPATKRISGHFIGMNAALDHHRSNLQTYEDVYVLAVGGAVDPDPDPDPDPPTQSGLFRTNGDPVTLARTNGDPVTLT